MTNAEIVKGIKCCMLIDYSCYECPYHQYGKTCNTMLYIDVIKFLPPIFNEKQEPMVKPTKCPCGELFDAKDSSFCPKCGCAYGELS